MNSLKYTFQAIIEVIVFFLVFALIDYFNGRPIDISDSDFTWVFGFLILTHVLEIKDKFPK